MFKKLVITSCTTLLLSTAVSTTVNAQSLIVEKNNEPEYSTQGIGTITIFLGGMLAGYIVDGVLIYATGYGYGDWVNEALAIAFNNPSKQQIFLPKASGGGSSSGGFSIPVN